jgi:transcriptional regulator with XRE-family HTH domain
MSKRAKWDEAIRSLRVALGLTQDRFALLIGVSKHTVVSWENRRITEVSASVQRRIRLATGATISADGSAKDPRGQPYARGFYEYYKTLLLSPNNATDIGKDSLGLILHAASRVKDRLPGVWYSFTEWLEQARENFGLGSEIDNVLDRRVREEVRTATYGEWRNDPSAPCWGFKDNKRKKDSENLTLKIRLSPLWNPGGDMR